MTAGGVIALIKALGSGGGGGGGGEVLVVHDVDGTLDKTWQEIHDAMVSTGAVCIGPNDGVVLFVFAGGNGLGQYHVDTVLGDEYYTDSANGYPTSEEPTPDPPAN